ncbi:MAG: choline ABC transporter ATP-binding protein [Oceanospirillaceae bacterium]|mgnify:CR=1 FL=1|uniref:choline ABC transporter ATP-binding protein n=2 Tax=unclassified Thalassolituus TaxID=2624967 RepID=UPI000C6AC11C|nr:choline ABC transporter ATP-binding protein [Thalassolituus sp. UBA6592]MBS51545.1 choline ABC transporter ATP-binding protein [Oceanospirillaceae bacterium]|tara:strand:- start:261 stop:1430 length:1170 start_codon:yes stop_codon:yes gene_type:complete
MIQIENLDVVFGGNPHAALPLLDAGEDRENIREKTGQVVGVKNASLNVGRGEICVLMGLSGSGKSSLLRCINGLNPVARGAIRIECDGDMVDFVTADAETQRGIRQRLVSMVFQKFALMPWLTVEENVAMPLEVQGMEKPEIERRVREQLDLVGLTEWRHLKPGKLSGGMQQRVGLARALAIETDILLMDEPFSALDPLIRTQLQDELLMLQKKLKKTILFVSHDLDEALKLGNHIAIMKDGEIVQHGKPEDIVLNPENDYVRDFVAHTNPLNVLRAASIMCPLNNFSAENDGYCLNRRDDYWLSEDKKSVIANGSRQEIVSWEAGNTIQEFGKHPVSVPEDFPMRDAMELRHQTGHAVFVHSGEGITGVVRDKELYHTLLGKMLSEDD